MKTVVAEGRGVSSEALQQPRLFVEAARTGAETSPQKVGCFAAHLFELVLAKVLVVSMPKTVNIWTSFAGVLAVLTKTVQVAGGPEQQLTQSCCLTGTAVCKLTCTCLLSGTQIKDKHYTANFGRFGIGFPLIWPRDPLQRVWLEK